MVRPARQAAGGLRLARSEQPHQRLGGLRRPRGRQRHRRARQVRGGDGRQRQTVDGRRGGGAHGDGGVAHRGGRRGEHDLALVLHQARLERAQPRLLPAEPAAPGGGTAGAAQGEVEAVRDGARGRGHLGEQGVGVRHPERDGHGVLLGQQQPLPRPARDGVQGVADVEQRGGGPVDLAVRRVGEPARHQGVQDHDVAQSAAGLLEVALEQVGELAVPARALGEGGGDLVQARPGPGAPLLAQHLAGAQAERGVAHDHAQVEQAERRRQVVPGDLPAGVDAAHGVVEPQPGVPDGVPDAFGQCGDRVLAEGLAVVQEDQVEVAGRTGVTPRVRPDRHEGDARGRRTRVPPHLGQPAVDRGRERLAPGRSAGRVGQGGADRLQQALAPQVPVGSCGASVGAAVHVGGSRKPRGTWWTDLRGRPGHAPRSARGRRPRPGRPRPCRRRSGRSGRP